MPAAEFRARLRLADEAATEAFGALLADVPPSAGTVYLSGHLGAGKTALARALLHARGHRGAVRSPSYTLMEPYATARGRVLHMDLYRLSDPLELANLGLEDYPPEEVLWLVEWPEHGQGVLPPADLRLRLGAVPGVGGRLLELEARGPWASALASRLPRDDASS